MPIIKKKKTRNKIKNKKLKTKVDDLDVGKLKPVPVDLKKLSDVVDNEVIKTQNSTQ